MELRQLTFAMAVAEAGSFTAAARRCHLSQSALSTQIAQLEAELGVRLFERTTRRVVLTEAGRLFLPTACRIVELADELRAQMSAHTAGALRTLRVGSTQTATRVLDLPAVLGDLRRRHPGARITMTAGPSAELLGAVADGSLDIALTGAVSPPPDPRLVFHPLSSPEPLVAIAPVAMSRAVAGTATLAELAASGPFIEFHAGSQLRTMVDALFRDAGLHREIIFELGQITDVARCAAQGLGAAVVPRAFTAGLDLVDAVVLGIEDRPALTIGAYIRRSDRTAMVRAVLELFGNPRSR
ncbi:LysR family transcriptional regulator [Mycolicibacterium sp. 120266]|jgi:DNA-binding transcriptional LysR family regulator|uniref:LysR family transcriptional regulator n=1 Tax=Mycolicibacterium sp. 120266 TaxID=3090601 RepID=UPI00299D1CB3|nr:LysR family transcriptional regulator [Mycolicibacterium sp. 120266]MDX1871635.1 LysR family transcriptional regulator [Mycolicibacterium sp. 120266]